MPRSTTLRRTPSFIHAAVPQCDRCAAVRTRTANEPNVATAAIRSTHLRRALVRAAPMLQLAASLRTSPKSAARAMCRMRLALLQLPRPHLTLLKPNSNGGSRGSTPTRRAAPSSQVGTCAADMAQLSAPRIEAKR